MKSVLTKPNFDAIWLVSRADGIVPESWQKIQAACHSILRTNYAARIGLLPVESNYPLRWMIRRRRTNLPSSPLDCILPCASSDLEKLRATFLHLSRVDLHQADLMQLERGHTLFFTAGRTDMLAPFNLPGVVVPLDTLEPHWETGRILFPVLEPEPATPFFLAALEYARVRPCSLVVLMKSELILNAFPYPVAAFGSPSAILREQRRLETIAMWQDTALQSGVRMQVSTDRSGLPFHTSVLDRVSADLYDLILLESKRRDELLWGRAIQKILRATPIPVWLSNSQLLAAQTTHRVEAAKREVA